MNRVLLLFLIILLCPPALTAQRGPGGVSKDGTPANCRLWVDAADLNLNDLDPVTLWVDKSNSDVADELYWADNLTPVAPVFRNASSAGINGRPAVQFGEGSMLGIGETNQDISTDLNSNEDMETTYEQTMFFVFRTGSDVTSRQIIWEEGGSVRCISTYIYNGEIYIGIADVEMDPDGVLGYGFSYKKLPLQPNTSYTLTFLYKAPEDNTIVNGSTSDEYFGIAGLLNGVPFPNEMENGCCSGPGVGGLYTHPDPLGIGGVNKSTYNESESIDNTNTGTQLFEGRIAEICYFAYALNTSERIIIENYLASKYNAGTAAINEYQHSNGFGNGVIGIGQESPTIFHNESRADNLFEIKINDKFDAFGNQQGYLLTGHNNGPLIWSDQNVPDPANVRRLRRTWRWSRTGIDGDKEVEITIDPSVTGFPITPELPPLPDGFTKYGVLIESSSANFPNFTASNSTIVEMRLASGKYIANVEIPDGSFATICAFRPTVQFRNESEFAIEGDPAPEWEPKTVEIELNYSPFNSVDVNVDFINGSAISGTDYQWNSAANLITFELGEIIKTIPFDIKNDVVVNAPSVRDFNILLLPSGSPPDAVIGSRDTLNYRIFDNNPEPKVTFISDRVNVREDDGTVEIPVNILGGFTGSKDITVRRKVNPDVDALFEGVLATPNVDFTGDNEQVLTFAQGESVQNYIINILEDEIHEYDESIVLEIIGASEGIGVDPDDNLSTEVVIEDINPAPTVSFITSESEGYRSTSNPIINVQLSGLSAKWTEVPFNISGGDAVNAPNDQPDFVANTSEVILIAPMDTVGILYEICTDINNCVLDIFVEDNETVDENRTIEFTLDEPVNANLGGTTVHTYTIKPYRPFEFTGAGGVGQLRNNTMWLRPDLISVTGAIQTVPNVSVTDVEAWQNRGTANRPTVPDAFELNGHKVLRFANNRFMPIGSGAGSDEGRHPLVNTGGQYSSKSMYMVFIPRDVSATSPAGSNSANAQMLYEQGGGDRGISFYILNRKLHMAAWNRVDENNQDGWGLNENPGLPAIVTYNTYLEDNTPYVVSWHYDANATPGLRLYVNGELADSYSGTVGMMFNHGNGAALGAMFGNTSIDGVRIPTPNPDYNRFFVGDIAEVIYFNEPNLTNNSRLHKARNTIIHNYLSAKFNIPLTEGQVADLDFADASTAEPLFNKELAGVGRTLDGSTEVVHGLAQGPAPLRVRSPIFNAPEAYLTWAHNGESLTDTWPYSFWNADLPENILERSGRVWKFYQSAPDAVSSVDIEINFGSSASAADFANDRGLLRLLTHTNEDPMGCMWPWPIQAASYPCPSS
ncbi:MAG: hypothetical protein LC670_10720 [Flavobacteriales bacterium]|nr:hypothetical protein [Flavobacteriales bacterium]